jgi:hypothetical protein
MTGCLSEVILICVCQFQLLPPPAIPQPTAGSALGRSPAIFRAARMRDGRPLAELAPKAGLTVEEWNEIEAGRVPDTWEHVLLLAAGLELDRSSWLPYLARLCEGAQEN